MYKPTLLTPEKRFANLLIKPDFLAAAYILCLTGLKKVFFSHIHNPLLNLIKQ